MKNIWKWILGIVVLVVVVAGLVGLVFVMHNRMAAAMAQRAAIRTPVPNSGPTNGATPGAPGAPNRFNGRMPPPRMGSRMGFRGPSRDGFRGFGRGGFGGFGPFGMGMMFFGMIGRLVPIAIVILLLYCAYLLGKRNVPAAAAAAVPAPPPVISTHPCPKCENSVQDGWKHCPNCGAEQ